MSLLNGDLTTIATAKLYMPSPPSDPVLAGLITRCSRMILSWLSRQNIVPRNYTEQYDGTGTTSLVLPNWPLITLTKLTISGIVITQAPQLSDTVAAFPPYGWRFQVWDGSPPGFPATIELVGGASYLFDLQNVVATYKAGYEVLNETIKAASYTPLQPYGQWATDEGVVYTTSGLALTAIASGVPAVGQYIPPAPDLATPVNNYTFNAADVTTGINASYGFVPSDLEQACLELIMSRASYRNRIDVRSQTLASQESISYDLSGMPNAVAQMLWPYRSVIPPSMGASV